MKCRLLCLSVERYLKQNKHVAWLWITRRKELFDVRAQILCRETQQCLQNQLRPFEVQTHNIFMDFISCRSIMNRSTIDYWYRFNNRSFDILNNVLFKFERFQIVNLTHTLCILKTRTSFKGSSTERTYYSFRKVENIFHLIRWNEYFLWYEYLDLFRITHFTFRTINQSCSVNLI